MFQLYTHPTSEDTDTTIEQQLAQLRLDTEEKEQRDRLATDFHASHLNTVTIYPKKIRYFPDRAEGVIVDYRLRIMTLPVSPCRSAAVLTNLVCDFTVGG